MRFKLEKLPNTFNKAMVSMEIAGSRGEFSEPGAVVDDMPGHAMGDRALALHDAVDA